MQHMRKNNTAQLEMFTLDDQDIAYDKSVSRADPLRLEKVRDYQKLIFKCIAFMLVSLVSFSLGVEKGKKAVQMLRPALEQASPKETADVTVEQKIPPTITHTPIDIRIVASSKPKPAVLKEKSEKKANYTIQVASISKAKNVKGELTSLKNKGYSVFSLVKGKYTVICVGRFNAKEDAKNSLEKLRNKYPDCQIRRL